MARVAALVGDPTRATLLERMLDGRAHTPTELALDAGVSTPTVSGHLARLLDGGLVAVIPQGRRRYYRLVSAEVARMLEGVMALSAEADARRRSATRTPPALREARTCYDHLAGRLAVAVADVLVARDHVRMDGDTAGVTTTGAAWLEELGVELARRGRRPACRPCLDWSERRPHLAGALGAALLGHMLAERWIEPGAADRAMKVTALGRAELRRRFDVV